MVTLLLLFATANPRASSRAQTAMRRIVIHEAREAGSDLEVTGLLAGLPGGSAGYVRRADLLALPQVRILVTNDENFAEIRPGRGVRISGVPLEALARSLRASPEVDLIDALCTDDYRAHYPAGYVAAHHPLLALTIEGLPPAEWAARAHQQDPGPYFVTHAHFSPAFKVLTHWDQPQVPTNVLRLNFSTQAATYGAIAPSGALANTAAVQQGFAIAKQNCLRCHNQGAYGGTKAGRNWSALGTWAREQPAFFASYVHDPQGFEPHAHMAGSPQYDQVTLAALTAYFQTFARGAGK